MGYLWAFGSMCEAQRQRTLKRVSRFEFELELSLALGFVAKSEEHVTRYPFASVRSVREYCTNIG